MLCHSMQNYEITMIVFYIAIPPLLGLKHMGLIVIYLLDILQELLYYSLDTILKFSSLKNYSYWMIYMLKGEISSCRVSC